MKIETVSKDFNIERGTKQGDPISPVFFNAMLKIVMRDAKQNGSNEISESM